MKCKVVIGFLLLVVLTLPVADCCAQRTVVYTHPDAAFQTGYELFQKQKYGSAQKVFQKIVQTHEPKSLVRVDAEYYAAICGIELFNKDGEMLLRNFIQDRPESPHVKTAYFYLGKYNYRKKKYQDASEWFEKVDVYDLTKDELPEFYFKRGYSYFELQQPEKAKKDFFEIKDVDTRYTPPANYYYSHLAYTEKNYETALGGFVKLTRNETFGGIVPYYIAQIYYLQNKYNEVIAYAPPLLDSSGTRRAPEIARIIGESYFKTARYSEAIPYLKKYERSVSVLARDDSYELGYAYYMVKDYDNAATYLQGAVSMEEADALTQNAYYHLADCYIRKNQKQFALSAFYSASKISIDKKVQEDALFNYAKLCYELAYNPYNEAVNAFKKYIFDYPASPRVDEAFSYLTNVYLTTKNYKEALASIESIRVLSPALKPVYQRIAYNRGVEFYNNLSLDSALRLFDKALVYSIDKTISSLSHYWKAEAQYRLRQFDKAIDNYKAFVYEPGAFNLPEFTLTNYNLGYAYFQKKDYVSAMQWFRKFTNSRTKEDPKKVNDAFIRIGDSYFVTKDYSSAADFYGQAMKMKVFDTDYAIYQQALALGVLHKNEVKISDLLQLLKEYPTSNYAAPAKYELGLSYLLVNNPAEALTYYKKVINEHSTSSYVGKSLLQTGLIYYGRKEDDAALVSFKRVVNDYPSSTEAVQAISNIRRIYVDKGDIAGFEAYLKDKPFANVSKAALDSSTYQVAKNHYFDNNCDKTVNDFGNYLQKYPEGIFILEANYYRSDCLYRNGKVEEAGPGYNYVVSKPKNKFTEVSLLNLSAILFKKKDYTGANTFYNRLESTAENQKNILEARIGQMRCNYLLKDHPAAIEYSRTLLSTEKISAEIINEAHMTIAKSAFETQDMELAMQEFKITATLAKSALGAEARYNVANIHFLKSNFADAKKVVFELVNQEPAHPYWMTKGLLLLSDVYVAQKDNFQAKTTLNSIISDSDIPELVTIAQDKLKAIIESEKPAEPKPVEELKIEFNNKGTENEIFKEELKKEGGQQ